MCVGKTKALIKFNKPLFYEPGKSGKEFLRFFCIAFITVYFIFYDFKSHFYILYKPTTFIFKSN